MTQNLVRKTISESFNRAAGDYDQAAPVQAQIAAHLVQKAFRRLPDPPRTVFDIGCGTGFVAAAVAQHWPLAKIAAIDNAPAMLIEARQKLPGLQTTTADIATVQLEPAFDLILSSMALHWLPDARGAVLGWQKGLKPGGRIVAALLTDGSFVEWRELCAAQGMADGLWPLPRAGFLDGIAAEIETQTMTVDYPSVRDFLLRLKAIGAATPRLNHKPFSAAAMRRLLASAPKPFAVTYRVLYIESPSEII